MKSMLRRLMSQERCFKQEHLFARRNSDGSQSEPCLRSAYLQAIVTAPFIIPPSLPVSAPQSGEAHGGFTKRSPSPRCFLKPICSLCASEPHHRVARCCCRSMNPSGRMVEPFPSTHFQIRSRGKTLVQFGGSTPRKLLLFTL